jgi:perosamine synthetase
VIPLFKPSCTDLEVRYVTDVLRSGWWGLGPKTAQLEHDFAQFAGAGHAVATSSATAALELALMAMDATGGQVIVPGLTFVSTGLAALYTSNTVVFADVDEDTLCIDWDDVAAKMTPHTKAIIPVWYAGTVGRPVPSWAAPYVIEDCAHAAGSPGAGRRGRAACWSFHAIKNIAAGDGGMITTADTGMAERLRSLRSLGIRSAWDSDKTAAHNWDYTVTVAGRKAYMNDITASLALAQLERLDELNQARKLAVLTYLDAFAFADRGWLALPAWDDESSWHMFTVRVPAADRDRFVDHLHAAGVSAGCHYKPLTSHPVFGPGCVLPVTDRIWRTLVTLPLYPDMTTAEQNTVIGAVLSFRPDK